MSVKGLEPLTNGLKGQFVKNAFGNQRPTVLRQSIGRVEWKVSWLRLLKVCQRYNVQLIFFTSTSLNISNNFIIMILPPISS